MYCSRAVGGLAVDSDEIQMATPDEFSDKTVALPHIVADRVGQQEPYQRPRADGKRASLLHLQLARITLQRRRWSAVWLRSWLVGYGAA